MPRAVMSRPGSVSGRWFSTAASATRAGGVVSVAAASGSLRFSAASVGPPGLTNPSGFKPLRP